MVNAAIVGLGNWGRRLVESVQGKSDKIRFVAAVSRDPARHDAWLTRQGVRGIGRYEDALAADGIDAVVLATPHSQHHGEMLAAAAAGKHVWVEKPMTLRRDHAAEAAMALDAAGLTLAVGFTRRFLPAYAALMEAIDDGRVGKILHVEGQQSGPSGLRRASTTSWRNSRAESPAGAMTGRGIHVLDMMIHIGGPVTAMAAVSERKVVSSDMDDTTAMLTTHAGGATGYLGTIYATANIWRVHAFGSAGHAEMRGETTVIVTDIDDVATAVTFPAVDKERRGLEAFADAIAGGAGYPVTAAEAVNGVAVLAQIESAARAREWVEIG
jgi:predicted dehydrogenase